MKNFDISLYGNIIIDNVLKVSNFKENKSNELIESYISLGGAANLIKTFLYLNGKLKISLNTSISSDEDGIFCRKWFSNLNKLYNKAVDCSYEMSKKNTSKAVIVSDNKKNIRTSIVNWGACADMSNFLMKKSKWHHFLYIDKLKNLNATHFKEISEESSISVDFCLNQHSEKNKKRIFEILKYVDYVFISDAEAESLMNSKDKDYNSLELAKKTKGIVVLHTPRGSIVSDGEKITRIKTNYISDMPLDVLGAGDIFAAFFINKMIENSSTNVLQSIKMSHDYITGLLLENGKRKKI